MDTQPKIPTRCRLYVVKASEIVWETPGQRNPNPFIEIYLGGKPIHTTATKMQTLAPLWNERVGLETNDPTSTLTLNLHHRSTTPGRISPIGSKELTIQALEDLAISKPNASLDLYDNDKKIGVVVVRFVREGPLAEVEQEIVPASILERRPVWRPDFVKEEPQAAVEQEGIPSYIRAERHPDFVRKGPVAAVELENIPAYIPSSRLPKPVAAFEQESIPVHISPSLLPDFVEERPVAAVESIHTYIPSSRRPVAAVESIHTYIPPSRSPVAAVEQARIPDYVPPEWRPDFVPPKHPSDDSKVIQIVGYYEQDVSMDQARRIVRQILARSSAASSNTDNV